MSESESDKFYFEIQDESIRETLAELPYIMQLFHNPLYDLNETVGLGEEAEQAGDGEDDEGDDDGGDDDGGEGDDG